MTIKAVRLFIQEEGASLRFLGNPLLEYKEGDVESFRLTTLKVSWLNTTIFNRSCIINGILQNFEKGKGLINFSELETIVACFDIPEEQNAVWKEIQMCEYQVSVPFGARSLSVRFFDKTPQRLISCIPESCFA